MITRAQLIDVLFVIVPHSLLLDFAGPVATLPTSVGLALGDLVPLPKQLTTPTWVVVVGQPTAHVTQVTPEIAATAQWLRDRLRDALVRADTPHRLVTICSGTLLAARAGLLGTR